ncbi:MAG: hypothetical protein ACI4DS_07480 [Eubacterium sp.]
MKERKQKVHKEKVKIEKVKRIKESRTEEDLDRINSKRKIYSAIAATIVIIVILVVVISGNGDKNSQEETTNVQTTTADTTTAFQSGYDGDNALSSDCPEITILVENYYKAIVNCDVDELVKYVDNMEDIDTDKLQLNASYIEAYKNIQCYTKNGPYDNTFVVYVYYENKIKDIETLAPGASVLYVLYDTDTKTYCIHNGVTSTEILTYIDALSSDEDVVTFNKMVNDKLKEACDSDEELAALYSALSGDSDD